MSANTEAYGALAKVAPQNVGFIVWALHPRQDLPPLGYFLTPEAHEHVVQALAPVTNRKRLLLELEQTVLPSTPEAVTLHWLADLATQPSRRVAFARWNNMRATFWRPTAAANLSRNEQWNSCPARSARETLREFAEMNYWRVEPILEDQSLHGAVLFWTTQPPDPSFLTDTAYLSPSLQQHLCALVQQSPVPPYPFHSFVHTNGALNPLLDRINQYATRTQEPILIVGETGSGKELVAKALHDCSRRNKGPFNAVNCAAIPEDKIESELFGYVEKIYGGNASNPGLIVVSHGGSLFLDEIGKASTALQAKLLRVLDGAPVCALGSSTSVHTDVRFVFASNVPLDKLVSDKNVLSDFQYRLGMLISVPPLRDHSEDIPLLAKHFVGLFGRVKGHPTRIATDAAEQLRSYSWPGNVRQLRNAVESMCVECLGCELSLDDVHTYAAAHGLTSRQ